MTDPPRRPRILHLIESDGFYGAENVVLTLAREALRGGEFEPLIGVFVDRPGADRELLQRARALGIGTLTLPLRVRLAPFDIGRTIAAVRPHGIDLVHAHGHKGSIVGFAIHRVLGIPLLPTCHLRFVGADSPPTYRAMMWLENNVFKALPRVVGVSGAIGRLLSEAGVPAEKIVVIQNGIAAPPRPASSPAAIAERRRALGLGPTSRVAINVARLTEQKAHRNLVRAIRPVRDAGHDLDLLLIGDGELRDDLLTLARAEGVADHVHLLGFRADVPELMELADLFVLPSLDEGLPMSLLEAMFERVPIIATRVGGIPEAITKSETGLLLDPGDVDGLARAMTALLGDDARRLGLAERAAAVAEQSYSASAMYAGYVPIYRASASRRR